MAVRCGGKNRVIGIIRSSVPDGPEEGGEEAGPDFLVPNNQSVKFFFLTNHIASNKLTIVDLLASRGSSDGRAGD